MLITRFLNIKNDSFWHVFLQIVWTHHYNTFCSTILLHNCRACVCVLNLHVLCLCSLAARSVAVWHSNQVLLHMFLVSAPCFPQRAGQLIASLVIGGLGRGHDYHLAHNTANMAGFLFHLPLKLNHFCAKIDCWRICIASLPLHVSRRLSEMSIFIVSLITGPHSQVYSAAACAEVAQREVIRTE